MLKLLKLLFNFSGQIGRIEYLVGILIAYAIFFLFSLIPLVFSASYETVVSMTKIAVATIYLIDMFIYLIINLALATKRLRDLQWSLWLLPLFVIPIIGLIMQLLGIVVPGENK